MVFWAGLARAEMQCEDTSGNRVPPSCKQEEWALQRLVQDPELRKDERASQRRNSYMGISLPSGEKLEIKADCRWAARQAPAGQFSIIGA